jgi:hypothetical protein
MKPLKLFVLTVLTAACSLSSQGQAGTDSLLNALNSVLANKDVYVQKKQDAISKFKIQLSRETSFKGKYIVCDSLYEQYKSFNYDSAYYYAKSLRSTAIALNDPAAIASSKIKLAFTLLSSGLFREATEQLKGIAVNTLPVQERVNYYFLQARMNFDEADYDHSTDYYQIYNPAGISYIDSALALCQQGTVSQLQLQGLKDLRTSNYTDGRRTYNALLKIPGLSPHDFAINACCLSYICEVKGPEDEAINLLIKAAITDIGSATKETVAIYKLADLLHKKGDIKNSYVYIQQAMDDATFYGAKQRQVGISGILPIIEAQWVDQIEHQKRLLYIYSAIITLLGLSVVLFAVIIFRQLKKLRIADEVIKAANRSLQENNLALEELNKNLSIANKIKNEYIGYYFNINSIYIEKLESFQKSLEKKLSSKRYEDAQATVKNLNLEEERQHLFHTFDKVFLRLFPDFVKKFNTLFNESEQICIPEGQLLSTEHRIFALIRMGIHDNDRIAKLLGYSVNTIYSYKNRIKNRSFIPNDDFEDHIMAIEAV